MSTDLENQISAPFKGRHDDMSIELELLNEGDSLLVTIINLKEPEIF
jgi:hypothetical protein